MPDEWSKLYSAVKERKMAQLGKKEIVQKVEEKGRVLAIQGKYEKPKKVLKNCYAAVKEQIKPYKVPKQRLEDYDLVIVGCPGTEIPKSGVSMLKSYVLDKGGWLLTTDWVVRSILEYAFPGFVRWNGQKTADAVVPCKLEDPTHPFLDGIWEMIRDPNSEWVKDSKGKPGVHFSWWLEDKSFPIEVLNHQAVKVLISSHEIYRRWGAAPVLLYFDVGTTGGRIVHMISHTHLQKGKAKGKLVSAMILTNILDEKITALYGLKKKGAAPQYAEYGASGAAGTPGAPAAPGTPASNLPVWDPAVDGKHAAMLGVDSYNTQYGSAGDAAASSTGSDAGGTGAAGTGGGGFQGLTPELTETSQVVEVTPAEMEAWGPNQKCALGDGNFDGYEGTIYKCSKCGAPYHEACLNWQMQEGTCKICGRILLF